MEYTDRLLKQAEVKGILNVADSTLESWRQKNHGPIWRKIGKSVRYRLSDVIAFIDGLKPCNGKKDAPNA